MNNVIYDLIKKFDPKNINDLKNSFKEVLQRIILTGLAKTDFFKKVVFYGGTSLRIFRGLPRFSEDLDFTLIKSDENVELKKYVQQVTDFLMSYGVKCDVNLKEKNINTTVESCYIKFNFKSLLLLIFSEYADKVNENEIISIKIEIERDCFEGGIIENKLLTYPSFSQIKTFSIETLFASKLMAILNRKWQSRVKGRDFYDYLFYIANNTKINIIFLENGLKKYGYLHEDDVLTLSVLKEELRKRLDSIDFDEAKKDVLPFIKNDDQFINSFNKEIFISSIDLIETL